jgi:hypothetical protein
MSAALSEGVRFAGYAAIFDREDNGGDVIRPGAFAGSLERRRGLGPGRGLPLLWQHAPDAPIGFVEAVSEDDRGLRVIGRLTARGETGRKAAAMLASGAITGLSFGYRVEAAAGERPRVLSALDIVEVSLVSVPMQPLARVHAVAG